MAGFPRLGLAGVLLAGWASCLGLSACSSSSGGDLFGTDGPDAAGADATLDAPIDGTPGDTDATNDATDPPLDSSTPKDASHRDSAPPDAGSDSASDSGSDSASDAGSDSAFDSGSDSASDSGPDSAVDAGVDCGLPYPIFTNPNGPFCPFTATGPASCAVGQHCCEYTLEAGVPSTCNEANAACLPSPGAIDWGCDEVNDCPSSQVCCYVGQLKQDNPACPNLRGTSVSGTVCRPGSCNAGERVACGAQADCASGTCTGINVRGKDLGLCLP